MDSYGWVSLTPGVDPRALQVETLDRTKHGQYGDVNWLALTQKTYSPRYPTGLELRFGLVYGYLGGICRR